MEPITNEIQLGNDVIYVGENGKDVFVDGVKVNLTLGKKYKVEDLSGNNVIVKDDSGKLANGHGLHYSRFKRADIKEAVINKYDFVALKEAAFGKPAGTLGHVTLVPRMLSDIDDIYDIETEMGDIVWIRHRDLIVLTAASDTN